MADKLKLLDSAGNNPPSLGTSEIEGLPVTEDAENLPIQQLTGVNFNLGSHITVESNTLSASFGGINQPKTQGGHRKLRTNSKFKKRASLPNDENRVDSVYDNEDAESLCSAEQDGDSKYFQQKDQELESLRLMLATHTKEFNKKRQSVVSNV